MGHRVVVLIALVAGCRSTASIGTTASGGGGGFTITAGSELGFRVGDNFDVGLTSNLHFGNWTRTANAYGAINDWAGDGAVECCGKAGPILTFFKYCGVGMGYLTAWILATDAMMVGPRLRYYVQPYAPTLYFDLGVGPSAFFDEDRNDAIYGTGVTTAAGYMFDPNWGIEVRSTWGNANDPQWATFSVGLVIKPKKRFLGLFGRNDLEKPTPPPQPPQPYPPQPYPPQPYPPQPYPPQPYPPQPYQQPPAQPQPAPQPQPQQYPPPQSQPPPAQTQPQPAPQPQPSPQPQSQPPPAQPPPAQPPPAPQPLPTPQPQPAPR